MVATLKSAFLFPGQGAQYPRMALDLLDEGKDAVKKLFKQASEIMELDMKTLLTEADARLRMLFSTMGQRVL